MTGDKSAAMFAAAAPVIFVLVWSTGFVVARATIPHADPMLIVLARMAAVSLLLGAAALAARERWPRGRKLALHGASGAMLPGLYLTAGWWAVAHGMPAGIMSLLGSLTPLLVGLLSFLLGLERLAARGWAGLAIGLGGVALVLAPAITRDAGAIRPIAAAVAMAAVLAMAGATMVQHRFLARDPLRSAGAVQNGAGAVVALVALLCAGSARWDGSPMLWAGVAWSVLALSAGALSLLSWMLRHQGATRVAALLLLTPPLAAAEAWALFGETLGPVQLAGFAAALAGVVIARSPPVVAPVETT